MVVSGRPYASSIPGAKPREPSLEYVGARHQIAGLTTSTVRIQVVHPS